MDRHEHVDELQELGVLPKHSLGLQVHTVMEGQVEHQGTHLGLPKQSLVRELVAVMSELEEQLAE